jgi:histidinol-phosphate aminotransferase
MQNLVNPNIIGLSPYVPGIPLEEIQAKYKLKKVIKLASNENPFPLPGNVIDSIKKEISVLNRYPDSDSHDLLKAIARHHGIETGNIIAGCGSVEIIKMIIKTFLKPGERVLTSKNTFIMFKIATLEHAGSQAFAEAEMEEGYRYNLDEISRLVDEKTKIIFIANPNNPTGSLIPKEKLLAFIETIPDQVFIVLDNAYQEYVTREDEHLDGIDLALNRKNIIVLRTFSKIYALAGLRVGYGIANEEIIAYLNQVRPPFNVTRLAQRAAEASLENDDFMKKSYLLNRKNRQSLFIQLKDLGFEVIPSETNFIIFSPGKNTKELNQRLLREGVIIRPLHAFGIPEAFRVTIGFEEDNNYFIEKMQKVLADIS